jgi:hypothetical protein
MPGGTTGKTDIIRSVPTEVCINLCRQQQWEGTFGIYDYVLSKNRQ